MKVGGLQCIIMKDEYVMPINIINGLPYIPMRPYTDEEWVKLPHVLLTAERKWDPRVLDGHIDNIEEWATMFEHVTGGAKEALEERPRDMKDNPFDENGYYIDRALLDKDPPIQRIKEDAHRRYRYIISHARSSCQRDIQK